MDTAENAAMASQDEGNVPLDYQYYNAKTMEVTVKGVDPPNSSRLLLTPNSNFFNIAINTNVSAVHVPTNVYDRGDRTFFISLLICWSEVLAFP